jgi:hypothetical protein
MDVLPQHLGGHANITHIDRNSVTYLRDKYGIKTAYDIGCGPGGMVREMIDMGIDCIGIDGDYTIVRSVPTIIHDFSTGPLHVAERDFGWSVEFLEHVDEIYMDNYFQVFASCRVVLVTASQNPKAHHHVNVKPCRYWIEQFFNRGFSFCDEDTSYVRHNSDMKREFIRETGMVFTSVKK